MPVSRRTLLALGAGFAGMACDLLQVLKPAEVSFSIDKEQVAVGEELEVRFSILERGGGQRYWVTFLPESAPFDDPSGEVEMPHGTQSVRVSASSPGPHSVRVLSERGGQKRMVAWRKVGVSP
ncbi:MAG: hypothetical protein IPM35_14145 [Myxococcales bacterium]|nr:hypothetical protein [Myxococcales bacterium]